jgi:hypothetical protein
MGRSVLRPYRILAGLKLASMVNLNPHPRAGLDFEMVTNAFETQDPPLEDKGGAPSEGTYRGDATRRGLHYENWKGFLARRARANQPVAPMCRSGK